MKTDLERDYTSTCVEILSAPWSKFLSISFKIAVTAWHATQVQKTKVFVTQLTLTGKYVRMATPTTQACNNSELSKGILSNSFVISNWKTHRNLVSKIQTRLTS
jgi:hypothetical protein